MSADLDGFLRLMADPTRRRIFLQLMAGETCNCKLVGLLRLPENLISHHLQALRRHGLVRERRDRQDRRWIHYSVDTDKLARVHRELGVLFDPSRIGPRIPACRPEVPDAERRAGPGGRATGAQTPPARTGR